jgi:hypothetical protein
MRTYQAARALDEGLCCPRPIVPPTHAYSACRYGSGGRTQLQAIESQIIREFGDNTYAIEQANAVLPAHAGLAGSSLEGLGPSRWTTRTDDRQRCPGGRCPRIPVVRARATPIAVLAERTGTDDRRKARRPGMALGARGTVPT